MEEEDSTYLKLPVEDRCVHKLWKARLSGYEESVKLFNSLNGDDERWKKFHGLIKKFVTDINAVAQEKGLLAALSYCENCDTAGRNTSDIVEGLVTKCVAAPKTNTKDLAKQICLMLCEIECCEKVVEELLKGFAQKNPKVVAGCISNVTICLRAFGCKLIKVSPLLKGAVPLLDHRDKGVREECKKLIIESYRWVGEVMKVQLTGLKPVQLTELEAEFEKIENVGKAKPERLLRSQQAMAVGVDGGVEGEEDESQGGEEEEEESLDPYDMMNSVDILAKIPKNFYDLVEEKKWQLRKEALDALLPLSQTPKISTGDFNDLIRVLKKLVAKDSNVMIVAVAAQCIGGLAKGLRGSFKQGAVTLLPVCLEKFKEKKTNVISALQESVDAMYPILGIENIQEDCLSSLKHKTPSVNAETARFLARCFSKCPPQLMSNKKVLKGYVSCLLEKLSVSDPNVRDASSEALGALMKYLGEPTLMKLMPDLDNIKLAKIKEYCEKAELTGKSAALKAQQTQKAKVVKPSGAPSKARVVSAASSTNDINKMDNDDNEFAEPDPPSKKPPMARKPPAKKGTKPGGGRRPSPSETDSKSNVGKDRKTLAAKSRLGMVATAASNKKKTEEDTGAPYVKANLKNSRFKDETKLKVLRWNFTTPRAEFIEQLNDQMTSANFNKTLMTQMFHNDFKQHIKVIDTLTRYLREDLEALKDNLDLILKWITLRFFETSPSVLIKGLEYLQLVFNALAEDSYLLHDIEAVSFIPYLVNKVGDPKEPIRNSIKAIFKTMTQIYAANKLVNYLMNGLMSKNAKQRAECLDELSHLIKGYGTTVLQPSPATCLKEVAKQISDRDNGVRNAALNTITEVYCQDGERMYKMIGNLPEKDMAMLEERIKRSSKTKQAPVQSQPLSAQTSSNKNANSNSSIPSKHNSRSISSAGQQRPSARQRMTQQNHTNNNVNNNESSNSNNNIHSNNKMSPGRPMSGAFTLNYEEIEAASEHRMSESGPRLVRHNLDDIFNDDISLPQTQTSKTFSPTSNRHPGNNQSLTDNAGAYEVLDLYISQVFSLDTRTAVHALSEIDELIKDPEKVQLFAHRLDQFLVACSTKYKHVLFTMMPTDNCNQKDVINLLHFVTIALMSLYHCPAITKDTSLASLHDLIEVIINIISEPQLQELPGSNSLTKALNVLTIKIVDRSHQTNVICAFLRLLRKSVDNTSLRPKFGELVMRCLWRIIRSMGQVKHLQVDVLLAEVHEFLKAYPSSYWKKQKVDTPMRTVKTITHALAKAKGSDIMNHLDKVNDPENSELVPYLQKLMNCGVGTNDVVENRKISSSASKLPRFSKSDQETLAEIFKKIGQKDLTKQGLEELYNFKQQNPRADLEPFWKNSTQYFKDYIEKGLKKIEREVKANGDNVNLTGGQGSGLSSRFVLSDNVANDSSGVNGAGQAHTFFLDRLKRLRAAGGLDNDDVGQENKQSANSHLRIYAPRKQNGDEVLLDPPSGIPTSTSSAARSIPEPAQLEEIRKRLEKVKQSAF